MSFQIAPVNIKDCQVPCWEPDAPCLLHPPDLETPSEVEMSRLPMNCSQWTLAGFEWLSLKCSETISFKIYPRFFVRDGCCAWWNKISYFKTRQEKSKQKIFSLPIWASSLPYSVHCSSALFINQTSPMAEIPALPQRSIFFFCQPCNSLEDNIPFSIL